MTRVLPIVVSLFLLFCGVPAKATQPLSKQSQLYNRARIPGVIYGHCTILPSIGQSLPVACAQLTLILSSSSDEEVLRTQTDSRGGFKFKVKQGPKYTISTESSAYEVQMPQGPVVGGDVLDLKLNLK